MVKIGEVCDGLQTTKFRLLKFSWLAIGKVSALREIAIATFQYTRL